jgi:hypothetical protein
VAEGESSSLQSCGCGSSDRGVEERAHEHQRVGEDQRHDGHAAVDEVAVPVRAAAAEAGDAEDNGDAYCSHERGEDREQQDHAILTDNLPGRLGQSPRAGDSSFSLLWG